MTRSLIGEDVTSAGLAWSRVISGAKKLRTRAGKPSRPIDSDRPRQPTVKRSTVSGV